MPIEMDGLPVPKPLIGLENLRFYPNTLTNVDVYINNVYNDTCNVSVVDDYCYISTKLYYPSDTPADAIVTFTSSGYDYFSVSRPEITASSSENPILVTFHPAVAIPNITVNDSDYWETHKSEYNALIGNPVGTFKLDLSSYNTTDDTLYAWTTENTSTASGAELPITFYTKTSTPTENSTIYNANGTDITSSFVHGAAYFSEVTTSKMTWTTSEPV